MHHNVRIDTIGGKNDRVGGGKGGSLARKEAATHAGGVRREAVVLIGAAADVAACRDAITALLNR